jgi:hypothetical protein
MNNESVARRPDYIAFRFPEAGRFVVVIATLQHRDHTDPPRAFWHSSQAPWGELKRAPAEYMRLGIDELTAKRMSNLIAGSKSLPDEFIERMPVLHVGVPDFPSPSPVV